MPVAGLPPEKNVIVEVLSVSLDVAVRVIVSPIFAMDELALLERIDTAEKVGAVKSTTTPDPVVVAITATPELPAKSVKAIENVAAPFV